MGGISKQNKGCSLGKRECENPNIKFWFSPAGETE